MKRPHPDDEDQPFRRCDFRSPVGHERERDTGVLLALLAITIIGFAILTYILPP